MKRDKGLDVLRGVAMSLVILVHCFYWVYFFKGQYSMIIKSLFLIEMPLFSLLVGHVMVILLKVNTVFI